MTDIESLSGRVIDDRYVLQSRLGSGGMGAVYLATQRSMDRAVAVKLIAPRLITDEIVTRRFLREARLSGQIAHPHVVSVFDSGRTADGLHYLVMERIEGRTLADAIAAEGPFSIERAVRIAAQICDGLAAAHARDIVHRDLKPANIMLVRGAGTESVKLLDFGLARSLANDQSMLTETGVMFGTPTYMPPEVARGENCDGRGDLYALGIILYEMLAGQPPFSGTHALALAMQHANSPPPLLPPAVPPPLATLVEQLLSKEADDRPDSAAALRPRLMATLDAVRTPASLDGVVLPTRRRWPYVVALSVAAAGGLIWALTSGPSEPSVDAAAAPPSVAPATEAPAAPKTEAPATEQPAAPKTEAPATEPPAAPKTEAPATKAPRAVRSAAPRTRPRRIVRRAPRTAAPKSTAPASKAPATLPGSFIRP